MDIETSEYDEAPITGFAARLLTAVADVSDAMESLMRIGAGALGNPIVLTDRGWNLIAKSNDAEILDDENWIELMANGCLSPESVTAGIRENLADKIESSGNPLVYQGSGMKYPRMLMRVRQGGKTVATVSVIEYFRRFRKQDEILLGLFATAMAAELQKHGAARHMRGILYEDFIESLLDGRLRDPNVVGERAKLFGVSNHKHLYVFVFDVSEYDPNQFSITYMRDTLEHMISGGRALIYDNKIIIIADFSRAHDVFKDELASLGAFLKKHNIRCGISRRCGELAQMRRHYEQACNAMRVGAHLYPGQYIYPYGEYAIYHIVEAVCASGDIVEYCHPALIKLLEYDQEYGAAFAKSLYTYLAHFRSMSKAAAELNLHRNTLLYHIQRAEDIMEIDLSDNNTSLLIELSFRMLEYEKKLDFGSKSILSGK